MARLIDTNHLLSKRYYSIKKKKHRANLHQFVQRRADRIICMAIQSWKSSHTLITQRRRLLVRIMKRGSLKKWKAIYEKQKHQEQIAMQVILNRWKYVVDEKVYRRDMKMKALRHRIAYLRKRIIHSWARIISESRGRLRTPVASLQAMRHSSSSDYSHRNNQDHRQPPFTSKHRPSTMNQHIIDSTYPCPQRLFHLNPFTRRGSKFSTDSISRRINYTAGDNEFIPRLNLASNRNFFHTGSVAKSPLLPRNQHSYAQFNTSTPRSRSLNGLDSLFHRKVTKHYPAEQLICRRMDIRLRNPYVPSWMPNDLYNQETKNVVWPTGRRFQSPPQNHEVVFPTHSAEPKDNFDVNYFRKSFYEKPGEAKPSSKEIFGYDTEGKAKHRR